MLRRLWPFLLIATALVLFFGLGLHERLSFAAFEAQRAALDAFVAQNRPAAVALYMALVITLVVLCLPASFVFSVIGGYLFGVVTGSAAALIAVTIGSTLFLLMTRGAVGNFLRQRLRGQLARLEAGFQRDALNYLIVLRLIPIAPVYLTNLAVGLVGMKLRDFVLATFFGMIPVTIVFAAAGHGLRSALSAGESADPAAAAQRLFLAPEILFPMLGLIALALAPVLWRRFRRA